MAKTPTEVRTVSMDDGRTVEFSGKKRLDKTVIIEGDTVKVRLDFVNGETRTFTVPPSLLLQCAGHGASQKLGDEISDITDLEDAIEAIDQLMARLEAGEWRVAREGGSSMAGASILAKALVEVTGQPIAVVRGYLASLDNKTKAALRASAEVGPTVQRLEQEKAARAAERGKGAPAIDVAGVLAGLSGAPA
jgi:hypothetical protein